jgi:hypothetical protein
MADAPLAPKELRLKSKCMRALTEREREGKRGREWEGGRVRRGIRRKKL